MTLHKLAIKNLLRKKVRSIAVVCVAALAGGLIFSATMILQSTKSSLELGMERLGADIMVVPLEYELRGQKVLLAGEPTSFYMDRANLAKITAVPGVKQAAPQLFMASAVLDCCVAPNVLLVGYDPKLDFTIQPWVKFSVQQPKHLVKLDPVTLGSTLRYLTQSDMRFYGKQFWIGSVLNPTGLGFLDNAVFMTMDVARNMALQSKTKSKRPLNIGPDMISSVLVKVDHVSNIRKVAADIETTIPGVLAIRARELVISERKNIEVALWGVIAAGVAFWFMLLIMMGLVFAMTVNERERELGILRAMGATMLHVFRLIITEASLLAGLGGVIGVSLGWAVLVNFKQLIIAMLGNIHFLWPSPAFTGAIGVACVMFMLSSGIVSVLYPAVRSCRSEPYRAIHQGL